MRAIFLPILEANMTHGVIRAWHKREGETVQAGEALFEVETDKVNAEVEAEASGVVRHIVAPVGTRVPVLSILAFVGGADEALPAPETWSTLVPATVKVEASVAAEPAPVESGLRNADSSMGNAECGMANEESPRAPHSKIAASPAARRLARERGIALDRIRPTGPRGEITRADVDKAATMTAVSPDGSGAIDAAFLALLRRDPDAFRALSSEAKVQLYREHGAQIGEGVRVEAGAIIMAPAITIGAASTIGADAIIECDRLQLGRLVALGKRTRVRCRSVEIGDALWSKDDVIIGGGGSDEAGAHLRAGDACFFGEGAYLNTCHPLTLGDEVCIGSRAMLFTHSHWQSVLRGYASLFGPIRVGDHVFIGNNAFIFPGVTVGAGATVMVNSFVALNVPPDTFVGGVPAQVIRHIVPPSRDEQIGIIRDRLVPELAAALSERGHTVSRREAGEAIILDLGDGGAVHFIPAWSPAAVPHQRQRAVVLTFADTAPDPSPRVTIFDLGAGRAFGMQDDLSDQVREFCRRRGIRFRPFAWRYGVGYFDGERFCPRGAGRK